MDLGMIDDITDICHDDDGGGYYAQDYSDPKTQACTNTYPSRTELIAALKSGSVSWDGPTNRPT